MNFTVQYPLFFVTKGDDVAFVALKHDSAEARANAIPVFTDRGAAEDFRDRFFAEWALGAIPDEQFFAQLLTLVRENVFCVAFDPYRMNTRVQTIPIEMMLEQLRRDVG
jgi:hypothetical protein